MSRRSNGRNPQLRSQNKDLRVAQPSNSFLERFAKNRGKLPILREPEVLHVLPAGGRRLVQRVDGYRATIVAGTLVFENGSDTGARPGRLVRAA